MHATDRITEEIAFHDRQARSRASRFLSPHALRFGDDAYLDHESWIRPAFAHLEPLADQPLLDLGCGHAMASVVFARRGAEVTATDLSAGYLGEAAQRAHANQVRVAFVQADAERLPFADASFSRLWGNAILHHLDVRKAAHEVHRVLKPGGVAVFCEPWGENQLLEWARRWLPYPGKERTRDEQPLRLGQLEELREVFPSLVVEGYQLLSMARRVLGKGRLTSGLAWCDDRLLKCVPRLTRYCRYVVLVCRRPSCND